MKKLVYNFNFNLLVCNTIFFAIFLKKADCEVLCSYYPFYPLTNITSVRLCPGKCCDIKYPNTGAQACCFFNRTTFTTIPSFTMQTIPSLPTFSNPTINIWLPNPFNEFTSTTTKQSSESKLEWYYIGAPILASLLIVIFLILFVFCCRKCSRKKKSQNPTLNALQFINANFNEDQNSNALNIQPNFSPRATLNNLSETNNFSPERFQNFSTRIAEDRPPSYDAVVGKNL